MSTKRQAFLQAILEEPDEDDLRLIYADWLTENGDSADRDRADFIRLQIEMESLDEETERYWDLEEKETELWEKHWQLWLGEVPELALLNERPASGRSSDFRRGFLSQVSTNQSWFEHGGNVCRRAPIEELEFNSETEGITGETLKAEKEYPPWMRIRDLSFIWNAIDDSAADGLAEWPVLSHLTSLSFAEVSLGEEAFVAMATSPLLSNLRHLRLSESGEGDRFAEAIAQSSLSSLESLIWDCCGIGNAGACALAESATLSNLTCLNLYDAQLGDEGVGAIAGSAHMARLKELHLVGGEISISGARALADSPYLKSLDEVYFNFLMSEESREILRQRYGDVMGG